MVRSMVLCMLATDSKQKQIRSSVFLILVGLQLSCTVLVWCSHHYYNTAILVIKAGVALVEAHTRATTKVRGAMSAPKIATVKMIGMFCLYSLTKELSEI